MCATSVASCGSRQSVEYGVQHEGAAAGNRGSGTAQSKPSASGASRSTAGNDLLSVESNVLGAWFRRVGTALRVESDSIHAQHTFDEPPSLERAVPQDIRTLPGIVECELAVSVGPAILRCIWRVGGPDRDKSADLLAACVRDLRDALRGRGFVVDSKGDDGFTARCAECDVVFVISREDVANQVGSWSVSVVQGRRKSCVRCCGKGVVNRRDELSRVIVSAGSGFADLRGELVSEEVGGGARRYATTVEFYGFRGDTITQFRPEPRLHVVAKVTDDLDRNVVVAATLERIRRACGSAFELVEPDSERPKSDECAAFTIRDRVTSTLWILRSYGVSRTGKGSVRMVSLNASVS